MPALAPFQLSAFQHYTLILSEWNKNRCLIHFIPSKSAFKVTFFFLHFVQTIFLLSSWDKFVFRIKVHEIDLL